MMKKGLKVTAALCCMAIAMPMTAWAADAELPIKAEAVCANLNVYNGDRKIRIKELKLTEAVPDAFQKDTEYRFYVKNMDFEQAAQMEFAPNTVSASSHTEGGDLIVAIKGASDRKTETITLSDIELTGVRSLPIGTYSLYMISSDGEKVPVVDDFVRVTNKADLEDLNIEIRMNENKLTVNGTEKSLRVPAYISKAGYTMLPIREVTEVFPYTNVIWEWGNEKDTATIFHGSRLVSVQAGADEMYINGAKVALQNTAEVVNGRMFISLRDISYICGILDKEIHWDAATKTVNIAVHTAVD